MPSKCEWVSFGGGACAIYGVVVRSRCTLHADAKRRAATSHGDSFVDQVGLLIYDGRVGYSLTIEGEPAGGGWDVVLSIRLSRAETNDLFLAGDAMVTWPVEGLIESGDQGRERSGMFVSEIAAHPAGLKLRYAEPSQVEKALLMLRARLAEVGVGEERE